MLPPRKRINPNLAVVSDSHCERIKLFHLTVTGRGLVKCAQPVIKTSRGPRRVQRADEPLSAPAGEFSVVWCPLWCGEETL